MFRNPAVDLLVVLLIALLIFGPKRLPTLGRSLGQGLREFKDSITGDSKDDDNENRRRSRRQRRPRPGASRPRSAPLRSARSAGAEPLRWRRCFGPSGTTNG